MIEQKDDGNEDGKDTARERKNIKIYCDGACQPNPRPMTIGVLCENPKIAMTTECGIGTNNVAECLAVIAALRKAKLLGLGGVTIYSDSRLVCNWVRGSYKCRSNTARTYVPVIEELIAELRAQICWCPGKTNPADALSRRQLVRCCDRSPLQGLDYVLATPMDSLRFRDFARLKVGGRDKFSSLRLSQLKELAPQHEMVAHFISEANGVAACLRWMLRGLPFDKALRKVNTDLKIA